MQIARKWPATPSAAPTFCAGRWARRSRRRWSKKPLFLDGAKANGVSKAKADEVLNLLDKFADYGFNKSHAAAYAVVATRPPG